MEWEIIVQNENGSLITSMNGNESICTVWKNEHAKLIEAAPEMFEMLKNAKSEFGENHFMYKWINDLLTKITQ